MTDPKDLKIAALREAVASNSSAYEERIADLRVALTQKDEQLATAQQRITDLEEILTEQKGDRDPEPQVVEGGVVE